MCTLSTPLHVTSFHLFLPVYVADKRKCFFVAVSSDKGLHSGHDLEVEAFNDDTRSTALLGNKKLGVKKEQIRKEKQKAKNEVENL